MAVKQTRATGKRSRVLGFFGTRRSGGPDHRRARRRVAQNARLFETQRRKNEVFARFVPSLFLEYLGQEVIEDVRLGHAVERRVTVMFSDLREFTALNDPLSFEMRAVARVRAKGPQQPVSTHELVDGWPACEHNLFGATQAHTQRFGRASAIEYGDS